MNPLFYVGILVPTVVTISLFVIFIYCWLLQRARKEVLTKKYDPHGRMRSLGMCMKPPRPPTFYLLEDMLFSGVGEDNVAYDVSRSPSTQQDLRGRALYRTYHDSGISAGLSPTHEGNLRQGLAYRTCPDSGISGLSLFPPAPATSHVDRAGCHLDDLIQRQPHLQHLYEDPVDPDTHQQKCSQQQSPQVALHQSQAQASVHSNDDASYSRSRDTSMSTRTHDSTHTQSKICPMSENSHTHSSLHRLTAPQPSLQSFYHDDREDWNSPQTGRRSFSSDQSRTLEYGGEQESASLRTEHHISLDRVIMTSQFVCSQLRKSLTPDSAAQLYDLPFPLPPPPSSCATATTKQFYRNSRVLDVEYLTFSDTELLDTRQTIVPDIDRPDSQASHSSTTDSEDSGFRSSYCAAHRKDVLGKQKHPLLKPLRKTTRKKNHRKCSQRTTGLLQKNTPSRHQQLIQVNPKHLQDNVHNISAIERAKTSLDAIHGPLSVIHRPLAVRQQTIHCPGSTVNEANYCSIPAGEPTVCNHSSVNHQHHPTRNIWAYHSTNDSEVSATQTIDLMDINSSKYLPGVSKPQTQVLGHTRFLEPSVQTSPSGQARLDSHDYSVA